MMRALLDQQWQRHEAEMVTKVFLLPKLRKQLTGLIKVSNSAFHDEIQTLVGGSSTQDLIKQTKAKIAEIEASYRAIEPTLTEDVKASLQQYFV